jgi:hypothetical protein
MSNRSAEYFEHMRSERWRLIKHQASIRSQGLCELCRSAASETHHINYPRGYARDTVGNVLHVCKACHRRLHGMHQLITDRQLAEIRVTTPKDRQATVWVDERRWVWAPWEVWARVLVIPTPLQVRLLSGIKAGALEQNREWGEPFELPDARGDSWFRWHAVDDGLANWAHRLRDRIGKGDATRTLENANLNEDERLLARNYKAIRKWGRDLQERALSGAVTNAAAKPSPVDNTTALAQAMALVVGVQKDHETRIVVIESEVFRDPEEFIDAKSFVIERGMSPDRIVSGTRIVIQSWLGTQVSEAGGSKGPEMHTRIEGTSHVATVNTYKRKDLLAALERLPKSLF